MEIVFLLIGVGVGLLVGAALRPVVRPVVVCMVVRGNDAPSVETVTPTPDADEDDDGIEWWQRETEPGEGPRC